MRKREVIGAHCRGHNANSIGICYEGGLTPEGIPADTRTFEQKYALRSLVRCLLQDYPGAQVYGHRELSPDLDGNGIVEPDEWIKQCPCFDVKSELSQEQYQKNFIK